MPIGPGIYDDLCTYVREQANANAAFVIVINGEKGSGFSCQSTGFEALKKLPDILETMAAEIRADCNHAQRT